VFRVLTSRLDDELRITPAGGFDRLGVLRMIRLHVSKCRQRVARALFVFRQPAQPPPGLRRGCRGGPIGYVFAEQLLVLVQLRRLLRRRHLRRGMNGQQVGLGRFGILGPLDRQLSIPLDRRA
jgi:hypothetical protein